MKFGIFYEHSVTRPWTEISEWRAYHQALEQICLADELGFDQVWEVEHHFLDGDSSLEDLRGRATFDDF